MSSPHPWKQKITAFWARFQTTFIPASREGRWLWWSLVAWLIFLLINFEDLRTPSETSWAQDLATNSRHTFRTYLRVGLWWGSLYHIVIVTLLVATGRWWGAAKSPATYSSTLSTRRSNPTRLFWILLLALCIVAGIIRWPKMSLSYWGDEGWAVAPYVYGKHVPVDPSDPQGPLVHKPVAWENTAFDDRTCGNHYLFSLCQRATLSAWRSWHNLPAEAFDETISRLPPFIAGIGSLALLALMLRSQGRPGAGLTAALMLALHPWHVRYSTEARGYTMMLFFLIFTVWFALIALRSGRWRWWLAFGAAEFLCMYSWKGVMYPLAAANAILFLWILLGKRSPSEISPPGVRSATVARWLVANLLAAGLFINLVYPCLLQIKDAKNHLIQLSGRPMGPKWLHDSVSAIFTGMPWHPEEPLNPTENRSLHYPLHPPHPHHARTRQLRLPPRLRRLLPQPPQPLASLPLARRHRLRCRRRRLLPLAHPCRMDLLVLPLRNPPPRHLRRHRPRRTPQARSPFPLPPFPKATAAIAGLLFLLLPAAYADLTSPEVALMRHQAYEDYRRAFQTTRGRHEPLHHKGPSNVYTVYLWRYISLYDPRGDTHVRRAAELRDLIAKVEKEKGELYVIVGHRALSRSISAGIIGMVEDTSLFEHLTTFWAPEELHCLHCYHYRPAPVANSKNSL
jgi:hypothetical protein